MSHALLPGAPAGYQPRATEFDERFVEIIRSGRYEELQRIDADLQDLAAEDVLDSSVIAVSAANGSSSGGEFLAYQGPFGVGYSVAQLFCANDE